MNKNLFYLLVHDFSYNKPGYHLLIDPAKIKGAKVKKMEVIKGWEYISDPSIPDVNGIMGIDKKETLEFDNNGNPVSYSIQGYSFDVNYIDKLSLIYGKDGANPGAKLASSDSTGSDTYWSGEWVFNNEGDRIASISYKDDPNSGKREEYPVYNFLYRADGSLEKITSKSTSGAEVKELIICDEKGRISTLKMYDIDYTYLYDKNGRITKESNRDEYGEKWEMIYKYDTKGNLTSVESDEKGYTFNKMTYTLSKDGLPAKAKNLWDTKSGRMGQNYEFRYTK
jgi:YD repeat-containing protein